jgi:hypothetical protein
MSTGGVGHAHDFDPCSGWCAHCNLREDGRLVLKGGQVVQPGRGYTPEELDRIRQRIQGAA